MILEPVGLENGHCLRAYGLIERTDCCCFHFGETFRNQSPSEIGGNVVVIKRVSNKRNDMRLISDAGEIGFDRRAIFYWPNGLDIVRGA